MVDIFYTGAGNSEREQQEPILSLGGFISESYVPNDFPGSIFGDFTQKTNNESIVFGLLNTEAAVKSSTLFTIVDLFKSGVDFKAGAVEMVLDDCGIYKTQRLPNRYSIPRGIDMTGVVSNNAYLVVDIIEDLTVGSQIQILDGTDTVVDFLLEKDPVEEIISLVEITQGYYSVKKFNYKNNRWEVFIFKENLTNFASVTSTSGLTVETNIAVVNQLSLGDLTQDIPVALFLQRIVNQNSKSKLEQNCERLFTNFKEGIETSEQFEFNFRIDYT